MSEIEVIDVTIARVAAEDLAGFWIDQPQRGRRWEGHTVVVEGWVVGRNLPVMAVELVHKGKMVRCAPVNNPRPDVAAVHPTLPAAATSGFRLTANFLEGWTELEVGVQVVLRDQRRLLLASLRGRRCWPEQRQAESRSLISVIIPCYRQARFLGEAIESVLAQTYPHVEIVVVDDGSPDNTGAVAGRYPSVHYYRQEHQGVAEARNYGIRRSSGNYLVFLDSDDRLCPRALETNLAALQAHPECAFVFGQFRFLSFDGVLLGNGPHACVNRDHYLALLHLNFIGMMAGVLFRRSVIDVVGGFNANLGSCEDYDLFLRVARAYPILGHDEVVAEYRQHGASKSTSLARMLQTVLSIHQAQWKFARGSRRAREAYRTGRQILRQGYGGRLYQEACDHFGDGEWQAGGVGLWTLLRTYPRILASGIIGPPRLVPIPGWIRQPAPDAAAVATLHRPAVSSPVAFDTA